MNTLLTRPARPASAQTDVQAPAERAEPRRRPAFVRAIATVLTTLAMLLVLGPLSAGSASASTLSSQSGYTGPVYLAKMNGVVAPLFGTNGTRAITFNGSIRVDRAGQLPAMQTQYVRVTLHASKWNPTTQRWEVPGYYGGQRQKTITLTNGTQYATIPHMNLELGDVHAFSPGYYWAWATFEWFNSSGQYAGSKTVSYQHGPADYNCINVTSYYVPCGTNANYLYF